ncbi:hypothetical protein [Maribacter sp. IgM3_T14_3]|uniref:hypothetical protein n=1 Tax=Maribacter sp. IgM3_T14_3 TaxID=3415140 RepID=UPI003C6F0F8A
MNQPIRKHILLLLLILLSTVSFAQKGDAILILKDSSRINGYGTISGISSIMAIRFKNDTLKYKKYKAKDLIGIDILENNYYRQFRYKYKDSAKFPELLEIVSIDSLSLYVRIYEGGVISNSLSTEPAYVIGDIPKQTVRLSNGQEVEIGQSKNVYKEILFPRYSYYVGHGQSDHVYHLYTKGLPFATSFKKSMMDYFINCPRLIEKVEAKEFSNDDLLSVLEFYNRSCLNLE